jgi:hypothetical protein
VLRELTFAESGNVWQKARETGIITRFAMDRTRRAKVRVASHRQEETMSANKQALIDKIGQLPPQRLAEVEDFVDFLRSREARAEAGSRLGESLAKLDALNLPPFSDEEIEAEIQAARQERAARRA